MYAKYDVSMSNHVPWGGLHRQGCRRTMTDKAWLYKALWLINQMSQKGNVLFYIAPFHRFFTVSKVLCNDIYELAQEFHCVISLWGWAIPSQIPGEQTGQWLDNILVSQSAQWTYLECTYSANGHHLPGTHLNLPTGRWKAESTYSNEAVLYYFTIPYLRTTFCNTVIRKTLYLIYLPRHHIHPWSWYSCLCPSRW